MPRLLAPIINPDDIVDKQYVDSVASAWNTVTITSNYTTIMGASSFVLNVGAITVVFELFGTDWRLIN